MLVITSAADSTDLTTLETVKLELGITASDEDEYIASKIERVSSTVCTYLNVAAGTDGTRTLGRETLTETFQLSINRQVQSSINGRSELTLARYPVSSITSVTVSGTALDTADYGVDGATGILYRLNSDGVQCQWETGLIVVVYVAGWLLPGDTGSNMPLDIEDATIGLIKLARAARERDPLVKSENFAGILSTTYWTPDGDSSAIPPDIAYKLAPYRNISV